MKEVVCYLLARLGGNERPTKEDLMKILASVGIVGSEEKMDLLFNEVNRPDFNLESSLAKGEAQLVEISQATRGKEESKEEKEVSDAPTPTPTPEDDDNNKDDDVYVDIFNLGGDTSSEESSDEESSEEE